MGGAGRGGGGDKFLKINKRGVGIKVPWCANCFKTIEILGFRMKTLNKIINAGAGINLSWRAIIRTINKRGNAYSGR